MSKEWKVDEVCSWLKSLCFEEEIIKKFQENKIDGNSLFSLTNDILQNVLKISNSDVRNKILEKIEGLKNSITKSQNLYKKPKSFIVSWDIINTINYVLRIQMIEINLNK